MFVTKNSCSFSTPKFNTPAFCGTVDTSSPLDSVKLRFLLNEAKTSPVSDFPTAAPPIPDLRYITFLSASKFVTKYFVPFTLTPPRKAVTPLFSKQSYKFLNSSNLTGSAPVPSSFSTSTLTFLY